MSTLLKQFVVWSSSENCLLPDSKHKALDVGSLMQREFFQTLEHWQKTKRFLSKKEMCKMLKEVFTTVAARSITATRHIGNDISKSFIVFLLDWFSRWIERILFTPLFTKGCFSTDETYFWMSSIEGKYLFALDAVNHHVYFWNVPSSICGCNSDNWQIFTAELLAYYKSFSVPNHWKMAKTEFHGDDCSRGLQLRRYTLNFCGWY